MDYLESMLDIEHQRLIENKYNKKHIDLKIREHIESDPVVQEKINHGIDLLNEYINKTYQYESKNERVAQLKGLDHKELITEVLIGVAYYYEPTLLTGLISQIASRLGFSDKKASLTTMAEILAVVCETDLYDITKEDEKASLMIVSNIIPKGHELLEFIKTACVLPPMVCRPQWLTHNKSTGYLTHTDSLILGKGNHHSGDICLDVLNKMNQVPLKLSKEFLSNCEEQPNQVIEDEDEEEQWGEFLNRSYGFYELLANGNNKFHFTHKVDKRGRIYTQGYHINAQGSAFKKAMIEFHDEEIVEGI